MFLVIDGSSMLSSNYYGSLPEQVKHAKTDEEKEAAYKHIMQTSNGVYTNGIYSSLRMVLDIINNFPKITHMAVVFDRSRNTFRRTIDPTYKAQRKPSPQPLTEQFQTLNNILQEIGISVFSHEDFEADDLAGSIIEQFKKNQQMLFMTKDHDYLQLIDKNVLGWMTQTTQEKADAIMERRMPKKVPSKVAWFDELTVLTQEGVKPHQIPDLKGLCGDTSDNIKGVAGVGPKAAIPLLTCYDSIEEIYKDIESADTNAKIKDLQTKWKNHGCARSPYKKLNGQKDIALLSKQLATIKRDIPVPTNLEQYKVNINKTALQDVLIRYEMNSLSSYI